MKILKKAILKFIDDDPMLMSATIAFYTIFSLPALTIITIEVAGFFYADDTVRQELQELLVIYTGVKETEHISSLLNYSVRFDGSLWVKTIGLGTLLFSATTVFMALQNSINKIWKLRPKPQKSIILYLINRLWSLAMAATLGFIFIVSLLVDTLLVVLKNSLEGVLGKLQYFTIYSLQAIISIALITFIFGFIFKVLPDGKLKWKDIWRGAFVTAVLFMIGKYLISYYLGYTTLTDAYGTAGSLILILVWIYYSSIILLFGAELTYTYTEEKGRKIVPNKYAIAIKVIEQENEN